MDTTSNISGSAIQQSVWETSENYAVEHIQPVAVSSPKLLERLAKEAAQVTARIEGRHKVSLNGLEQKFTNAIASGAVSALTLQHIHKLSHYHPETYTHSIEVGLLTAQVARSCDYDISNAVEMGIAGLVHDVGKGEIPLSILDKPGKLTDSEKMLMDMHATYSAVIIERHGCFSPRQIRMVRDHHDYTVKSQDTQILQVADVYSALTNDRCYRKAFTPGRALSFMMDDHQIGADLNQQLVGIIASYTEHKA